MKDCLFCKIVSKEVSSDIVYEDESIIAFLDKFPINKGHTLIIPKRHSKNFLEDKDKALKKLSLIIKKVGNVIMKATNADGMNIHSNINEVAGQVIFHTHVHLIPRFKGDGHSFILNKKDFNEKESQEIASKIKSLLK
jgi:histidine triad (HIT) family protein|tara:strand:+ start:134 stop:547 length:414 start_codon:yes stop_codon:yes gene_type:complete